MLSGGRPLEGPREEICRPRDPVHRKNMVSSELNRAHPAQRSKSGLRAEICATKKCEFFVFPLLDHFDVLIHPLYLDS